MSNRPSLATSREPDFSDLLGRRRMTPIQVQAATSDRVSYSTVYRATKGTMPRPAQLSQIAEALSYSVAYCRAAIERSRGGAK